MVIYLYSDRHSSNKVIAQKGLQSESIADKCKGGLGEQIYIWSCRDSTCKQYVRRCANAYAATTVVQHGWKYWKSVKFWASTFTLKSDNPMSSLTLSWWSKICHFQYFLGKRGGMQKNVPHCYGWDFWIMSLGVLYFLLEQKQGEGYKNTIFPPIHGKHDTWWYTLFCIDEASSSSIRKSVIETLLSASQSSLHQRFCHNHFFVIVITMPPTHNISQWCTFF